MDADAIRAQLERALAEHEWAFENFFLARFFGLDISYGDEDDERCVVVLPAAEFLGNPQGSLHGGVIVFAMDVSMGHLCNRYLSASVTLTMNVQFLRAVHGEARAEARFLKKGRQVVSVESRVTDEHGKLAAVGIGTWHRLAPEPEADAA